MAPKRKSGSANSEVHTGGAEPAALNDAKFLRHPTVERAEVIDRHPPYERLNFALNTTNLPGKKGNVVHWFRTKDLRIQDNRSLAEAAASAKQSDKHLYALFVVEPFELDFQGVGQARRAFMVEGLRRIAKELKDLGIPLIPLVSEGKKETIDRLVDFCKKHEVARVYAGYEYEFDELQRDITAVKALSSVGISFKLVHDQTVVEPGGITNAQGEPRRVFTPFWQDWIPTIAKDPHKFYLDLQPLPEQQSGVAADLMEAFDNADFDDVLGIDRADENLETVSRLWPAGYDAAVERLNKFLANKVQKYGKLRSNPADDVTSRLSPYLALGNISVREVLAIARKKGNNDKNFGTTSSGIDSWVREIAFREFYRQMMALALPHVSMNLPTSLKLADVRYETNEEAWVRWCEGKTGMPFIDAGMRQLNAEGYMHNRLRMNTSSYLRMNLLLDFRLGLRYFANKLVDWDCCNNSFGWDPNYTVFNPVNQGKKCDPHGAYIRKWVPELRNVQGNAIFDPANLLPAGEFDKLGYPRPMISQEEAKARSIERFKEASAESSKRIKKEEA